MGKKTDLQRVLDKIEKYVKARIQFEDECERFNKKVKRVFKKYNIKGVRK